MHRGAFTVFQGGLDSTCPPVATGKVLVTVQRECFMASGLLFADGIATIISASVFNTVIAPRWQKNRMRNSLVMNLH